MKAERPAKITVLTSWLTSLVFLRIQATSKQWLHCVFYRLPSYKWHISSSSSRLEQIVAFVQLKTTKYFTRWFGKDESLPDFSNVMMTQWLTLHCKNEVVLHFFSVPYSCFIEVGGTKNHNLEDMTSSELWERRILLLTARFSKRTLWLGHFRFLYSATYNAVLSCYRPLVVPMTHSCFASGVKMRNSSEILAREAKAQLLP